MNVKWADETGGGHFERHKSFVLPKSWSEAERDPFFLKSSEELLQILRETQSSIEALKEHNSLFESYVRRQQNISLIPSETATSLSPEQIFTIATTETKELKHDIEKYRLSAELVIGELKSQKEELEIRITELKKEIYEFRRDIVIAAVNPRTGEIMAEKVVKYFEEKIKAKVS
jgi:hypothetical protein